MKNSTHFFLFTPDNCFTFSSGTITNYSTGGVGCGLNVKIPPTIGEVAVTKIGDNSFEKKGLTGVIIPNSVTNIGNYAFRINNITNLTIGTGVLTIGWDSFSNNYLTSVTIPNSVKTISTQSFNGNKLTSVIIGSGVTNIGYSAFVNNPLLSTFTNYDGYVSNEYLYFPVTGGIQIALYIGTSKNLTIPSSINGKSVVNLGTRSFGGKGMTGVVIPNTVTSILQNAFYSSPLQNIIIPNSVTSIGAVAFGSQTGGTGTVYGPSSGYVYNTYLNNTNSEFDKSKLTNYSRFTFDSGTLGNGVVKDMNTGRMWQSAVSSSVMTWYAAMGVPTSTIDTAITEYAGGYCYELTLGGVSKGTWRLPTKDELMAIGGSSNNQSNYLASFTNDYFWSSTTVNNTTSAAYIVHPNGINNGGDFKSTSSYYVRCVR